MYVLQQKMHNFTIYSTKCKQMKLLLSRHVFFIRLLPIYSPIRYSIYSIYSPIYLIYSPIYQIYSPIYSIYSPIYSIYGYFRYSLHPALVLRQRRLRLPGSQGGCICKHSSTRIILTFQISQHHIPHEQPFSARSYPR